MNYHMIDLTPIVDRAGESLTVAEPLDLGEIAVGDVTFALREPVSFEAMFTNTGDGILVSGSATAEVRVPCSRCAESFDSTIAGEISTYLATGVRDSEESPSDEEEYERLEGHELDVLPLILGAITIEAPFAPLCRPDCQGLCSVCGTDLNTGSCDCVHDEEDDNPFSSLKGMFTDEEAAETDSGD